jgi:hypothetical protein
MRSRSNSVDFLRPEGVRSAVERRRDKLLRVCQCDGVEGTRLEISTAPKNITATGIAEEKNIDDLLLCKVEEMKNGANVSKMGNMTSSHPTGSKSLMNSS